MSYKEMLLLGWDKVKTFFKRTSTRRIGTAVLFFLLLTGLLSVNFLPEKGLQAGQVAPKDYEAPRPIEFTDDIKTEALRKQAADLVGKVHEEDPAVYQEVVGEINGVFENIIRVNKAPNQDLKTKVGQLKEALLFPLPDRVYSRLVSSTPEKLAKLSASARTAVNSAYQHNKITAENLDAVKEEVKKEISRNKTLTTDERNFIGTLTDTYLQPNLVYNEEETKRRRSEAREKIAPVRVKILQGEKIVGRGERVTPDHIQKLQALGLQRSRSHAGALTGTAILVAAAMTVALIYLYQYRRSIYDNESHLFLLGLIVVVTLLLGRGILAMELWPQVTPLLGYLVPVATASMLIAILLDARLALIVTAILSVFLGVMAGNQLRFTFVGIIAGMIAVYGVSRLSQRSDLAKTGLFYVSAANIIAILSIELVMRETTSMELHLIVLSALGLGITNGILSGILTIGTLPYLETAFGITSSVSLLELSNPNHPLLKRLLMEAPGTYHHSIIVGNLAEAAADAVGGDGLLVRVGAYYHDIGKLRRPYFFIENQLSCENPHEKIAPSLSTLIITSHTRDGLEMAREHRVPQVILDIIEQHHGTSIVSFFFARALENDKNETVKEEDFRYEGPKPQTKEAALVMLADSVEAASRALQKPTPGRVEGLIRRVIKDKLNDGQLDECDLTFRDLSVIASTFMKVLSGIFHNRVEYPETVLKEIERRKARDAGGRK